jgi:hypothetical protein
VNKLGWPKNLVELFQREIATAFPEAEITVTKDSSKASANDLKDRHVLAAAICGGCPVILTFNLRHFKNDNLRDHGIVAIHPDDYLVTLFEIEPSQVIAVIGEIAGRRRMETEDAPDPVWDSDSQVLGTRSCSSFRVTFHAVPHRRESHQPPRRRGDEGVQDLSKKLLPGHNKML